MQKITFSPALHVKRLMEQNHYSYQYFATKLEMGIATLSRRLNEQNDFWLSEVNQMSVLFDTTPIQLFNLFYQPIEDSPNDNENKANEPDISYQKKTINVEQVNINKGITGSYLSQIANSIEENSMLRVENESLKKEIEQLNERLIDKLEIIELLKERIKTLSATK